MATSQEKIRNEVGLLELAKQLGNVSQACRIMGYSRDSLYRFWELYDKGGETALEEMTKRRPNPKKGVEAAIGEAVVELAYEEPAWGQLRVSNELAKEGVQVSPSGVRGIWQRHEPQTVKHQLKALEAKVAREGLVLTESQLADLEQVKQDKEAHGVSKITGEERPSNPDAPEEPDILGASEEAGGGDLPDPVAVEGYRGLSVHDLKGMDLHWGSSRDESRGSSSRGGRTPPEGPTRGSLGARGSSWWLRRPDRGG